MLNIKKWKNKMQHKKTKPATVAGSNLLLRTGRDSNPRPLP